VPKWTLTAKLPSSPALVPNIVLLALYGVAAIAASFAGYAGGLGIRPSRLPVYVLVVLVCAVIFLIQDLDRPSVGFISTSQQPMIDTATIAAIRNCPRKHNRCRTGLLPGRI
jgi:hypothetical protein